MIDPSISRRGFLHTAVTASAVVNAFAVDAAAEPAKTWRIGMIGTGARGREVLRALKGGSFPCEIVALCDVVPAHLQQAAQDIGGSPKLYEDYREFLEHQPLDVAFVSTPNYLHKEMVLAALRRGLDVFCEKPLGLTVAECDEMISAWRAEKSVFIVGLQNRYQPLHVKIGQLIAEGVIGDVQHIAASEFRGDWKQIDPASINATKVNWRHYDALSGGSLIEKHCHDFDLFDLWLGRHPVRVCGLGGTGYYQGRDSLDHASVVTEYENGCTVSLDFNVGVRFGKGFHEWTIVGTKGQLRFERKGTTLTVATWEPQRREEKLAIKLSPNDTAHGGTIDLFECLEHRRLPSANPLVGRQSVKTAQAAQQAIRTRQMVELGSLG